MILSAVETGDSVDPAVPALALLLLVMLFLALVVFVGSYVLVRAVRRFRGNLRRQRPAPTASEDVWAMHRLPEDVDTFGNDEDEE